MQRLGFLKPRKLARRARNQTLCRTLIQKFETTPTRGRHNKSLCSHFSKQHWEAGELLHTNTPQTGIQQEGKKKNQADSALCVCLEVWRV